jgi:hypothetical protein
VPARAALVVLALATSPLRADPDRASPRLVQGDPHAECYCRAQGRLFRMGEQACLRSPDGPRLARCEMELNVTSWRFTSQRCPDS